MEDLNNKCLKEILRQMCHPITGLSKDLSSSPVTVEEWVQCLSSVYGWVSVGINEKVANIFYELKLGEVIPSNSCNLNIYTYGFANIEIDKFLNTDTEKKYRAILNYYSFCKLTSIISNTGDSEYSKKFNYSLKVIYDCEPETFWLNIVVSNKAAEYLILNKIGEIIVNEGLNEESNIIKSKESVCETEMEESDCKTEMEESDLPYRLVLNNTTFLKIINMICIYKNVNLYESIGGDKEDFSGLFGKLQI